MKKNYNFILINFFRVTDPYSGASEVSFNFFKNIKSKNKKLFQFSDEKKKHKNVKSIIIKNTKIQKFLNLIKLSNEIINYSNSKKNLIIIFEGASWIGYSFFVFMLLKNKLKKAKFIYHSHNVEYLLRKKNNNILIQILTKYFEKYIANNFDIFTCVSLKDKRILNNLYNINSEIFRNGVDEIKNINKIKIKKFKFSYIFFCGSVEYYPNYEALNILVNKIMPKVYKKNPNIKVIVSGNKKLPFKKDYLINAGFLEKKVFYNYLKGASIFVNPMKTAFGSQLKIINALIFGKTIIASSKAVEGIEHNNNFNNLHITNSNEIFANLILKKINSKKFNSKISNYYYSNYLMKNIIRKFFKKNLF